MERSLLKHCSLSEWKCLGRARVQVWGSPQSTQSTLGFWPSKQVHQALGQSAVILLGTMTPRDLKWDLCNAGGSAAATEGKRGGDHLCRPVILLGLQFLGLLTPKVMAPQSISDFSNVMSEFGYFISKEVYSAHNSGVCRIQTAWS